MESIIQKAAAGYVKISIKGAGVERFLNLCCNRKIFPTNIYWRDGECICEMLINDYREIKPIVKKTGVKIRLLDKFGLPFFIYKYRKRGLLCVCLLLAVIFLYFMSCHIWSIRFIGNSFYSDEVLQQFLESEGIRNGMNKKSIDCDSIESMLRIKYNDITWVSVEIDGTLLKVNMKENLKQNEVPGESQEVCDIISEYDGTVLSIITRKGTPMVKEGDEVSAGQILISGVIDLHDDSESITGHRYVFADGDCYLKTDLEIDKRIDQSYEVRNLIKENNGIYIEFGKYQEEFLLPVSCQYPAEKETEISQLCLFDNFYLPVFWGKVNIKYYDTYVEFYPDDVFSSYCQKVLEEELRNLEKKGVEIMENNVIIQRGDFCAFLEGYLTVKIKAGVCTEISLPEESIENAR